MKKFALPVLLSLISTPCFASSVCVVYWNGNYVASNLYGAYVSECDGGAEKVLSSNTQSQTANLKVLTDNGYKIVSGGDRVILQK